MKRFLVIPISLLIIISFASAGMCASDMVAGYSFDEGSGKVAKDITGNGHNGEIKDANYVEGKFGKALQFDGTASQVVIPTDDTLNFKDGVTVEAWVKPTKYLELSAVVQKWGDNTNRRQYLLCFVADKATMYISGKGNTWPSAPGKTAVKTDEWTHIAGTYDLKTIRTYVNGKLDAETANTEGIFGSDVPAWIGGYGPDQDFGSNRHFAGVIDEVRYWGRALDENEISLGMSKATSMVLAIDSLGKLETTWGQIKNTY